MEMNLEILEPIELQLKELTKKYGELTIDGPADKVGYVAVSTARKDLGAHRVQIGKKAKGIRDEANKFSKDVIAYEKKLVAIIEPLEKELHEKELRIDNINALPERIRELQAVEHPIDEDSLLTMKATEYKSLYSKAKKEFDDRKRQEEFEKQRAELEAERIRVAEENARQQAELEAERKIKAVEEQAEQKIREAEQKAEKVQENIVDNSDERYCAGFDAFMQLNNFNPDTDILKGNSIYRLVATFVPSNDSWIE